MRVYRREGDSSLYYANALPWNPSLLGDDVRAVVATRIGGAACESCPL